MKRLKKKNKYVRTQKKDSFQFVSLTKTLTVLLSNEEVSKNFKECQNELLKNDSIYFLNEFWRRDKTLRILLYYDEIEIKNPLGDASCIYKLGMFYFTILNFSRKNNSKLKNIFTVAACYSDDIKKYGMNKILDKIKTEIIELETNGIKINNETYYASIAQFCGDNLAVHQVFGLKCAFIGENMCHLCNASSENIQNNFYLSSYASKTKEIYEQKIKELEINPENALKFGIKSKCMLNEIGHFHTTQNYLFDLTHDLWEGIIPLELSLIINNFICDKYFSIEFINSRILTFNYGMIHSKNKPSFIKAIGNNIKIRLKAAKMKCFF